MFNSKQTLDFSIRFMRCQFLALLFLFIHSSSFSQIKTIIEDFEGFADGQLSFVKEGIFSYGAVSIKTVQSVTTGSGYSGIRAIEILFTRDLLFGGWGKGIGLFKELEVETDFLNFYILSPDSNFTEIRLNVIIEDDDNGNSVFEINKDDQWVSAITVNSSKKWQLFSVPLKQFVRNNKAGDGIFNINHNEGRLLTVTFDFIQPEKLFKKNTLYFDFISISRNKMNPDNLFDLPKSQSEDFCVFGFWSEEGKSGNLHEIHKAFEDLTTCLIPDKIGVVSFYKPYSIDGKKQPNFFPEYNKINDLIDKGYLPMITFEAHHKTDIPNDKQPNLYSIVEGWFDNYFAEWGKTIAQVNGTILIRILHEFNGNWYPWCIANNDKNPELFIKAYRHIVDILKKNGAGNSKFIWCPNSISNPQEKWNFFADAYPGNEYVDFIGIDIFNGTGQEGIPQWRSFRQEGMDVYDLILQKFPEKPIIICETSCRERYVEEIGFFSEKSDWIKAQSEALQTDMSKIKLVVWFNEPSSFRINSTYNSFGSFLNYFWSKPYFRNSPKKLFKN